MTVVRKFLITLATSLAVGAALVSVPAAANAQDADPAPALVSAQAVGPVSAPAAGPASALVSALAAADAQDPATAPGAMASTGCDSTSGPPAGVDSHWQTYVGGGLFWGACVDCHADALMLGALGWRTWCWETVAPSEVAELWYGHQIAAVPGANPGEAEQLTKVASREEITALLQAAAESRR